MSLLGMLSLKLGRSVHWDGQKEQILADPEANITPAKMRKLTQVARAWLTAHRNPDCSYRFDAVSVVLAGDCRLR